MSPTNNLILDTVASTTFVLAKLLPHHTDILRRTDMKRTIPENTKQTKCTSTTENKNHSSQTSDSFIHSDVVAAGWKPAVTCHTKMEVVNDCSPELHMEIATNSLTHRPLLCTRVSSPQQSDVTYNSNDRHHNRPVVGTDETDETHKPDNKTGQKKDIRMEKTMELLKQRWIDLFHNRNPVPLENSKRRKPCIELGTSNSDANEFWIELLSRHANIMDYVPGAKLSDYGGRTEKLVGMGLVRITRFGDLNSFSTIGSSIRILRLVKCNLKNGQLNGLEKLRNLEVLDLSENELKHFTTDENALPHLIALNLSNNRLCTLDQLSGPYPALRELNVSSNFLMRIGEVKITCVTV
ncbi:hypothetical protein P879_08819 [Paragonimus westermani]|uniref:Uncharacterized protein n=1 Tax=Paragonimus westermani TaxID=34504 RepID=A0A8T0DBV1_9TREM|nr:hypothetical protein P879_08819 [Paragonimus westermani]